MKNRCIRALQLQSIQYEDSILDSTVDRCFFYIYMYYTNGKTLNVSAVDRKCSTKAHYQMGCVKFVERFAVRRNLSKIRSLRVFYEIEWRPSDQTPSSHACGLALSPR